MSIFNFLYDVTVLETLWIEYNDFLWKVFYWGYWARAQNEFFKGALSGLRQIVATETIWDKAL